MVGLHPPDSLVELKIFTLVDLTGLLQCSAITARRRLSGWQAYTSINRNGMFYALPGVPQFDSNGLWHFHKVFFSAYGNLKETVVRLVQQSPRGLDRLEMGQLVGLPAGSSYLSRLRDLPELGREWLQGRWVYLAGEEMVRRRQLEERLAWEDRWAGLPSPEEAVDILVCLVRHPEWEPEALAAQLAGRRPGLTAAKVRNLLEHHDLGKKKHRLPGDPMPE